MTRSPDQLMTSRWAVQIEGHEATIGQLETYLNDTLSNETDTFVSRLREVPVLRSSLWNRVDKWELVEQLAQVELVLLQGLTKLCGSASPLSVGTVFELDSQDSILLQTRRSVNSVLVLSRNFQSPQTFRHNLDVARRHDALSAAVMELAGPPDWVKIFKALEYLGEHCGGGEKELLEAFPKKKAALKRVKRTAQSVRHRARLYANNYVPYKLEEAEKLLQGLIAEISASEPTAPPSSSTAFRIMRRDYPADQVIGLRTLVLVNGKVSEVALVGDTLSVG